MKYNFGRLLLMPYIHLQLLLSCLKGANCGVFNGFEYRELSGSSTNFGADLLKWTIASVDGVSQKSTACGGSLYLGGFGVLKPNGETTYRVFGSLPSHNMLWFSLLVQLLDNWDSTDYFTIKFDSIEIPIRNFAPISNFRMDSCNENNRKGARLRIMAKVPHNAPTVILGISGHLNGPPTDRSFGVRELYILASSSNPPQAAEFCIVATITLSSLACPCSISKYKDADGICQDCHPNCLTCSGPSSSECFRCASGCYFDGTRCVICDTNCSVCFKEGPNGCSECASPKYLLDDKCITDCDLPMTKTTNPRSCNYACTGDDFLYTDGTCHSACPSPLITEIKYNRRFCKSGCPSGQKILHDGSCTLATCPYPLLLETYGPFQVCSLPCSNGELKLDDGSCISSSLCVSPLTSGSYVCSGSCQNSQEFLSWDGICRPDCPSPFEEQTISSIKLCQVPFCDAQLCTVCQTNSNCPQNHYCQKTTADGVCKPYILHTLRSDLVRTVLNGYLIRVEVNPPRRISDQLASDMLIADIPSLQQGTDYTLNIQELSKGVFLVTVTLLKSLEQSRLNVLFTYSSLNLNLKSGLDLPRVVYISPEIQEIAEIAQTSSYVSFGIMTVSIIGYVMTGGLSALWSFLPENQYSYYLIYLNVDYPYHTKLYFRSLSNYDLLLAPAPDEYRSVDRETQQSLPTRFAEEDYSMDFLENAGQTLAITFGILLALAAAALIFKAFALPRRSYLAHALLKIIRRILKWNGLVRQFLAYSLPLGLASLIQLHVSIFSRESFPFSTFLAVVILLAIGFGFHRTHSIIRHIPPDRFERSVYNEWYGTLWDGLDLESNTKYYYWLVNVRAIFLCYVCVFFGIYPYIQITVLILLQLMIMSLFLKNYRFRFIFESKALSVVTFGEEALLLLTKLAIFFYSVMHSNQTSDQFIIIMGWVIVAPGIINQITQSLYSIGAQIAERKKILEKIKSLCRKKQRKKLKRVSTFRREVEKEPPVMTP